MLPRKVQIKIYAETAQDAALDSYIPAFHRLIQNNTLEELLIDVAYYGHVPQGPGVVLVGHAADYSLDQGEGRPGLCYFRKRDLPEEANLVQDALRHVLHAASVLAADQDIHGPRQFGSDELLLRFPERLYVKNDQAGFEQLRPTIESALAQVFPGKKYTLHQEGEAREPLTIRASL